MHFIDIVYLVHQAEIIISTKICRTNWHTYIGRYTTYFGTASHLFSRLRSFLVRKQVETTNWHISAARRYTTQGLLHSSTRSQVVFKQKRTMAKNQALWLCSRPFKEDFLALNDNKTQWIRLRLPSLAVRVLISSTPSFFHDLFDR